MADTPADAEPAHVARKVAELHRSLNLSHGPLMRGLLILRGPECPGRLFLAAHHAAIDVVSWRILLDDFDALHRQLEEGHSLRVAPETASFRQWAQRLVEQAALPDVLDEAAHWLRLGGIETAILPRDGHGGENTVASADVAQVSLTRDVTTSLLSVARGALQCRVDEVLLAAVTCGIARITGRQSILIDVESHGRDSPFASLDLSRTVGWFATLYPVQLTLPAGLLDYPEILGTIKRQLRQIPHGGHGYGLLRYLSPDDRLRTRLAGMPRPELIFNYVGQIDRGWEGYGGWFRTIRSFGLSRADAARRPYALELDLSVVQGELIMQWTYSRHLHSRRAIDRLAQACAEELAAFVEHSPRADNDRMFTPSDFPAARLDQNELESVSGEIPMSARAALDAIEDIYELTPIQQGLLFHSLYEPGWGVYVEQVLCAIRGDIDGARLRRAFELVVQRHAVLRTSYHWQGFKKPLQVVMKKVTVPWTTADWRLYPGVEQRRRMDAYLDEDRRRGFALDQAPVLRCALLQLSDKSYRLLWTFHHLLLDGWSLAIILGDLFRIYEALPAEQGLVHDAPRPYRDYVLWRQRHTDSEASVYWRRYLAGLVAPSRVTTGSTPSLRGNHEERSHVVPKPVAAALADFARTHRLTLHTIVSGALAAVLARHGGHPDVMFGSTVSGRPADLERAESMVGLFINALPLRVQVDAGAGLVSWLRRLQDEQVERDRHSQEALVDIQSWSDVPRGVPLFEMLLVFETILFRRAGGAGLPKSSVCVPSSAPATL